VSATGDSTKPSTSTAARDRVIVALDVAGLAEAEALLARLGGAPRVKVGLELWAAAGTRAIAAAQATGARVFLDLKLHDIPETVGRTVRALGGLGVDLLTVHASGGRAMLAAAAEAARALPEATRPRVLAVTVLTSMDEGDLAETGCVGPVAELVTRRAALAAAAGADGVVCSPAEAALVRAVVPDGFLIVTPGVRAAGAERGDQKRVATAAEAVRAGATHVVVGRPVRDAADPALALTALADEIAGASVR